MQVESCWNPYGVSELVAVCRGTNVFQAPGCRALLLGSSCAPHIWDQGGSSHPSRLAVTAGALLYPPLLSRAGATPCDLTNPLLFQGPKALARLLIPCVLPFLWLITYPPVHGTLNLEGFLAVHSSWDPSSNFALMIFVPAPLPGFSELQRCLCSCLIWECIPAPEKEQAFALPCALSSDLLTKLYKYKTFNKWDVSALRNLPHFYLSLAGLAVRSWANLI